jgi:hypothetical protein
MGCEESVRAQDTRDQLPYNPASHLTQFKGRLFMRRKLTVVWLGCIALTLLLSGAVAAAQTITGSVRGTVTDPNGLVVAGAQVVVTNTGTGVTTHTVTDKSGLYNVGFLVLGNYAVTATAPGFETASVGPFTVQIDQIVTADAKLQVGKASTTVDVVADQSLLLNTENSTISTSISSSTLENMPLDGMNIQVATLFVPGAINPSASAMGGQLGTGRDAFTPHEEGPADAIPSFNGNRQQSNSYILDGVDINETLQNAIGYTPSPFSIQEVHVITGNADAEFGNVNGGEVVMVTKSGTNQFHGSIFGNHQNSGLDANTWSNKYSGTPRSGYNQNQFGAAVGGPIFKNKLFFFGNYEGLRWSTLGASSSSVPTSAMRGITTASSNGFDTASACPTGYADFSAIANPNTDDTVLWNTTNGYNNETPYPGPTAGTYNCIPINPNNALATFLFQHPAAFPLPNHAPNPGTTVGGDYQGTSASVQRNDQGDIRLDYTLNSKDTFMGKFSYGDAWDTPTRVPVTAVIPLTDDYPFTNIVGAWTHIFSPAIVNNARAGLTRIKLNASIPKDLSGLFGNDGETTAGIALSPGWTQTQPGYAYMNLAVGDLQNFGSEPPIQGFAVDNNFDYNDALNWEHGKHITKFGFDFLRYQQDYVSTSDTGGTLGQFTYNGNVTANWNAPIENDQGYAFAEFLLDEASNSEISGLHGPFGQRQWRDAVFVQDDWKVMPNLTVNLGLRYSYEQPNFEVNNKMVNVNLPYAKGKPFGTPINSMLEYAGKLNPTTGKTNSRALINPYYLGFMPRFGFAYKVTPKMVVRGGYGSTDDLESTGSSLRMTQNVQFQPAVTYNSTGPTGTGQGQTFALATGLVGSATTAPGAGAQYYAWDPNMRPAVIQQFSLNVQYQIDSHTAVQAGYVGQTGQHLAVPLWVNQYTTDDNCASLSSAALIDACYQNIEPYFALVGNPNSPDNPGSDVLKETVSRGISNYHSLQASIQRHQAKGLEFLVNYTYGKSLTNNVGYFGVTNTGDDDSYWQDVNNPKGNYGPSSFDMRQVVSGTAVYQLPFGHGNQFGSSWNAVTDEILGGWQLSMNASVYTGFPLTVHQSGQQCANNCAENLSGDYFGFANHYGPMKITGRGKNSSGIFKWFGTDPSAEPCNSRGTAPSASNPNCAYGRPSQDFGTTHVGTLRGPGFQNYDMSLSKAFKTYREAVYIGGGNPINAFGAITGTNSGPRKLQISLVYAF